MTTTTPTAAPLSAEQLDSLAGHAISIDVSTGDEDAGNRIFAELTGETGSDGKTLIAVETKRNFTIHPQTTAPQPSVGEQALPPLPRSNDGKEQEAFEVWATSEQYEMETHPLHWLFLNKRTYAARQGWKAALEYVSKAMNAPSREEATAAQADDSFKPVYWFSILTKCARLLNLPTDEPIPSGVVLAVEKLVAAPAASVAQADYEQTQAKMERMTS